MELWCDHQMLLNDGVEIGCAAHLAEGRLFDCPYQSNEERMNSLYPCSDYKCEIINLRDKIKGGFIGVIHNCYEGWETPMKETYPESANILGGSDGTIQTRCEM